MKMTRLFFIMAMSIIGNFLLVAQVGATEFYVSPTGTASGTGTITSPWSLTTALSGAGGKIKPGDTVNLRGGTYTGLFTSSLTGTATAPIVVRSYPGEWAIIDGPNFADSTQVALLVNGAYTWYRDFEVMNSNPDRPVSFPYRPATLNVYGANTKFINMLIHDGGQGIGLWDQSASAEVHGCIIYNNGGEARDHGIYTQNNGAGTAKDITGNVIFNSYGFAIHAYGSGSVPLLGYTINDNTIVNDNSIIGNRSIQNLTFKNNSLYNAGFNFGYFSTSNTYGLIENNWFASPLVEFTGWKNMTVKNNKFWKTGSGAGVIMNIYYYAGYALTDYSFTGNKYYQFDPWESIDFGASFPTTGGVAYTFGPNDCCLISPYPSPKPYGNGTWQDTLGYDKDGAYVQSLDGHPTGLDINVRPNKYEPGRAIISVYNWDHKDTVTVDLSTTGLVSGDKYELHNAQNYKNQVVTGVYKGVPITIDMKNVTGTTTPWSVVPPVGDVPAFTSRELTFPEFGVFIIKKAPATTTLIRGDLSGDGMVSVYDASLAAQAAVGLLTLTDGQKTAGDVSGDGVITVYDAVLIVKYAIGINTQL